MTMRLLALTVAASLAVSCASANTGTTGSPLVSHPDVPGTVFTIVFENEDAANVISPANPYINQLAHQYGLPVAYTSSVHPSLPNYILMTSGTQNGVTTDADPSYNVTIPGTANLADQLDAAGVPWRAYMESMGDPCTTQSSGDYAAHHDPFIYYWDMRMNTARCQKEIVDFDASFATDLASNAYRFMWITPNMCNDMHNCSTQTGDAWLAKVVPQIMDSPGYKAGGAIFILTDEGNTRYLGASANLPILVVSPNLVTAPYQTTTPFGHPSYLATVEDILGLPRLSTTENVNSLDEFFRDKGDTAADAGTDSTVASP